jgi:hypothetical protein
LQGAGLAGLQGAALQAKVQALHMGDFEKCPGVLFYPGFGGRVNFDKNTIFSNCFFNFFRVSRQTISKNFKDSKSVEKVQNILGIRIKIG